MGSEGGREIMQIQEDGDEIIILSANSRWISEKDQRELLFWFKENRPMMCQDIFCMTCLEKGE